jgi:kynureninase
MLETITAQLDATDPLASTRALFALPDGVAYLDGNSLGALPHAAITAVDEAVRQQWGEGLIRSWNSAGWMDISQRVGARIATLIGAPADSVVACDSTSVNLYKALHAACAMRLDRRVILTDINNFPTDLYLIDSVAKERGLKVRAVPHEEIIAAITNDVAVVELTHVDYRSAQMYEMEEITAIAHKVGALVIWDLAHSAGAVPVDLVQSDADFAIGCGYKYLNGGPGAPAFIYIAPRIADSVSQPIQGWHGHAHPFEFSRSYQPAPGVDRMLVGTPPVLSMTALSAALDVFRNVTMSQLRTKSLALSTLFYELTDEHLASRGFAITSEREADKRGSHVALSHKNGYSIVRALIERGVIGDFRRPNVLRFGFAPLYNTFADVVRLVEECVDVIDTQSYQQTKFSLEMGVV